MACWLWCGLEMLVSQKGFYLGSKTDSPPVIYKIKGFDAHRVTGEEDSLLTFVPYPKRIHPPEFGHHPAAIFWYIVKQYLGITLG